MKHWNYKVWFSVFIKILRKDNLNRFQAVSTVLIAVIIDLQTLTKITCSDQPEAQFSLMRDPNWASGIDKSNGLSTLNQKESRRQFDCRPFQDYDPFPPFQLL